MQHPSGPDPFLGRGESPRPTPRVVIAPHRLAVLDLGANSFHLVVAETTWDGGFVVHDHLRERVQIGEEAFREGRISADASDRGVEALLRLRRELRSRGPCPGIGVATSVFRETDNGRFFVARAGSIMGFPVRILDGHEEARLVHAGVMRDVALAQRRVAIFDIGGGSTEIVVGTRHGFEFATSLPIGTLRSHAAGSDRDSRGSDQRRAIERAANEILGPALAEVSGAGFDAVVFACGGARSLLRLAGGSPEERGLALTSLLDVEARLEPLSNAERLAFAGSSDGGVDTSLPAAVMLRVILERLGESRALVSPGGLREGAIVDHLVRSATGESHSRPGPRPGMLT